MPLDTEKRERITTRVPARLRSTLEEAAELVGATLNQFIIQSAYEEAQRILVRESTIRLSREDAKVVFEMMEHPPAPNERLKAAARAYKSKSRGKN